MALQPMGHGGLALPRLMGIPVERSVDSRCSMSSRISFAIAGLLASEGLLGG
ncbi:hypothetical protein [Synechococcus sp. BIOS-U3-1]|uniref:hypothetical protein n=1 Tax=Synechococcus sp. BIOS-U3-1 TaxID=1400865 RepID=UPI0016443855|nr:hypothetical protein [Synechococcus sp. BIOS-U3-1]